MRCQIGGESDLHAQMATRKSWRSHLLNDIEVPFRLQFVTDLAAQFCVCMQRTSTLADLEQSWLHDGRELNGRTCERQSQARRDPRDTDALATSAGGTSTWASFNKEARARDESLHPSTTRRNATTYASLGGLGVTRGRDPRVDRRAASGKDDACET